MLGKLIKYEFKATGRKLFPIYFVLLVLSIINKILFSFRDENLFIKKGFMNFIYSFSVILYIAIFVAVGCLTVIVIIQRFYKNILKDEGYLMNTLPVTPSMNIAAKLITAIICVIICNIIVFSSILILAYSPELFREISFDLNDIKITGLNELGGAFYPILFEILFIILCIIIVCILMVYTSLVIGHLFNKYKVLLSFGAFIVLNTIYEFGMMIGANIYMIIFLDSFKSRELINTQIILLGLIGGSIAFSAILFALSSYLIKNKLNLE